MTPRDSRIIAELDFRAFGNVDAWEEGDYRDALIEGVNVWGVRLGRWRVIGSLGLTMDSPEDAYIFSVSTDPEFAGRGIATSLIEHAAGWATEAGARRLVLDVRESNLRAQRLYEHVGFNRFGTGEWFYSDEDSVKMERLLRR